MVERTEGDMRPARDEKPYAAQKPYAEYSSISANADRSGHSNIYRH
jgi:hypothetical protein